MAKRYLDLQLTGASRVARRHPREIHPPNLAEITDGYLSRSDACPQVRPPLAPISDSLSSITGASALQVGASQSDDSDYVNGFFYSWGIGSGLYLTKYGPIYDVDSGDQVLYAVYDAVSYTHLTLPTN